MRYDGKGKLTSYNATVNGEPMFEYDSLAINNYDPTNHNPSGNYFIDLLPWFYYEMENPNEPLHLSFYSLKGYDNTVSYRIFCKFSKPTVEWNAFTNSYETVWKDIQQQTSINYIIKVNGEIVKEGWMSPSDQSITDGGNEYQTYTMLLEI
jgi:hypothetical protein